MLIERRYLTGAAWEEYHRAVQVELKTLINPDTKLLRGDISKYRRCPVCNDVRYSFLFTKAGFRFVRCSQCGMIYVNPIIDKNKYGDFHTGVAHQSYARRTKRVVSSSLLERAKKLRAICSGGNLLDIGCGDGLFLEASREIGFNVWGVEINQEQAKRVQSRLVGSNILYGDIEGVELPLNYFHCVTMYQVIEHLPNPLRVLRAIYNSLQPGGILVMETPNVGCFIVKILRKAHNHFMGATHLNYFSAETLLWILRGAGFREFEVTTAGEEFTPAVILQLIINPARFDFFNEDYFKMGITRLERIFSHPTILRGVTAANPIMKRATNYLKLGSYIKVTCRRGEGEQKTLLNRVGGWSIGDEE